MPINAQRHSAMQRAMRAADSPDDSTTCAHPTTRTLMSSAKNDYAKLSSLITLELAMPHPDDTVASYCGGHRAAADTSRLFSGKVTPQSRSGIVGQNATILHYALGSSVVIWFVPVAGLGNLYPAAARAGGDGGSV